MKQRKRSVIRRPNAEGMRLTAGNVARKHPQQPRTMVVVSALRCTAFVIEGR